MLILNETTLFFFELTFNSSNASPEVNTSESGVISNWASKVASARLPPPARISSQLLSSVNLTSAPTKETSLDGKRPPDTDSSSQKDDESIGVFDDEGEDDSLERQGLSGQQMLSDRSPVSPVYHTDI
jgi:hypothetical protein